MKSQCVRVVKVGGSLLDLPDLAKRLVAWLDQQPLGRNILVPGGGSFVEDVRKRSYGDEISDHWTCIVLMDAVATNLADWLPGSVRIENLEILSDTEHLIVFAPWKWLEDCEPSLPGIKLPESWDVTSDSIAARLAICIGADELVLLKSAEPPSRDLQLLADAGYVDKFLPKLASELPLWRMVNLRG